LNILEIGGTCTYRLLIVPKEGSVVNEKLTKKGRIKLKHKTKDLLKAFLADIVALQNRLKTSSDKVIVKVDSQRKSGIFEVDQAKAGKDDIVSKRSNRLTRMNSFSSIVVEEQSIDLRK
jgi:hypothetical protein